MPSSALAVNVLESMRSSRSSGARTAPVSILARNGTSALSGSIDQPASMLVNQVARRDRCAPHAIPVPPCTSLYTVSHNPASIELAAKVATPCVVQYVPTVLLVTHPTVDSVRSMIATWPALPCVLVHSCSSVASGASTNSSSTLLQRNSVAVSTKP